MASMMGETLLLGLAEHLRDSPEAGPCLELGDPAEVADDGSPRPSGINLASTPAFARLVADAFAARSGLARFEEFQRLFASRDLVKPAKPSQDFLDAQAQAIEPNAAKRPYLRALLTEKAQTAYFSKLSEYEKERKERERITENYQDDDLSYVRFVCAACPEAHSFFFDRYWTLPISEESRKRHTYLTGGSGSGKTEALKAILLHYLTRNTSTAVVLLDPTGKLSGEVIRWPELSDGKRLAYIDAAGIDGRQAVFNPLDVSEEERNPDDIAIIVNQLIEVFPELIDGLEFTSTMRTLISACLTVLLHAPGSSLLDLMDFLDDEKNAEWLALADRVLVGSLYREFFKREFRDKTMDMTKRAVRLRFMDVLGLRPAFRRMIIGRSTFNLEHLLNRRAVVVFRLTKGEIGEASSKLIGKFVMARLKAYGFRQGRKSSERRMSVHIFIDECHNFLSESVEVILKEARQYGLHLTLAQQILGADMSPALLNSILGNTDVKITGKNALHTLKRIADETGASLAELQNLSTGYFHIKSGDRPSVVTRIPSNRINSKGAVSAAVWEQVRADQAARFYQAPGGEIAPTLATSSTLAFPID